METKKTEWKRLDIEPMGAVRTTRFQMFKDERYQRYNVWKKHVSTLVGSIPEDVVGVHMIVMIPMPASWSKKKRLQKVGTYHDQKPDLDNVLKGFMDATLGEDKMVAEVMISKYWGVAGYIEYCWIIKSEENGNENK